MPDIFKAIRLLSANRQSKFLTRRQSVDMQASVDGWINGPTIPCTTPWTPGSVEPAPEAEELPWLVDFIALRAQHRARRYTGR